MDESFYMTFIGTPNNYNLVDTKEEMFSTVNTNTENTTEICQNNSAHLYDY
jgi:S-ribosylhomocysteine lyase LuxS involved in autoinducer biosynthesis